MSGLTRPAPVTTLVAAAILGTTGVHLTWTDPNPGGLAGRVERSTDGFAANVQVAGQVVAGVTAWDDAASAGNIRYSYRVIVSNPAGDAVGSAVASILTLPGAPVGLMAAAPTDGSPRRGLTQVDLVWANSLHGDTQVERSDDGGTNFTLIALVAAPGTHFTDIGRTADTRYDYRLRGSNASGTGASTEAVAVRTLKLPPPPPTGLTLTSITSQSIDLSWILGAGSSDGIRIDRKVGSAPAFSVRTTLAAGITHFQDTGLAPASQYSYRVVTFNNGGDSTPPLSGSAATLPLPPAPPSDLVVAVPAAPSGRTTLDLSWRDNSDNESGYTVQRSADGGANWTPLPQIPALNIAGAGGTVTASATQLTPNTTYRFRVKALNTGGASDWSATATATTLPNPPTAPTDLLVSSVAAPGGQNMLALSWIDRSDNEESFAVEQALAGSGTWTSLPLVVTPNRSGRGGTVTLQVDDLAIHTAYQFRVCAVNAGGASERTGAVSGTTLPQPPGQPGNLIVAVPPPPLGQTQLVMSWTDTSDSESGFAVQQSLNSSNNWTDLPAVPTPNTAGFGALVTLTVGQLAPNIGYRFRIRSVNAGGASEWTAPAGAATLPLPPLAPSGLSVVTPNKPDGTSRLQLAWSDNSDNETGFRIERHGDGEDFQQIALATAGTTTYADNGLISNHTYSYRVRATNSGGDSEYTPTGNGATYADPPVAPSDLTVNVLPVPEGRSKLFVSWKDSSANEQGFRLERRTVESSFAEITTTGANSTAYLDTGLDPGVTYVYRLRAYNMDGNSAHTVEAQATTIPLVPGVPELLRVAATSATALQVEWSYAGSNPSGFKVELRVAGGAFGTVATPGPDARSWIIGGLAPATAYDVRMRAINGGGESGISSMLAASTPSRTYSLSGKVTEGGVGLAGVTVTAGNHTAVSDTSGAYSFVGLAGGDYTITAAKTSYVFDPPSYQIALGEDLNGKDFVALAPFNLTLAAGEVRGGQAVVATVRLRKPGTAATTVTLSSGNSTVAKVPKSLSVRKGKDSGTFKVTTKKVAAPVEVVLTATSLGVSKSVRLRVVAR